MKAVLITTEGKVEVVDLLEEDSWERLKQIYKLCECDCIDITERNIGGRYFDIVCDDEGLLKDDFIFTSYGIMFRNGKMLKSGIVGNIIVTKHDEEGEMIGLSEDEVSLIMGNIRKDDELPELPTYILAPNYLWATY